MVDHVSQQLVGPSEPLGSFVEGLVGLLESLLGFPGNPDAFIEGFPLLLEEQPPINSLHGPSQRVLLEQLSDKPTNPVHVLNGLSMGKLCLVNSPEGPSHGVVQGIDTHVPGLSEPGVEIGKDPGKGGISGIEVIDVSDFKTKAAREARDAAYAEGKTPLLPKEYQQVQEMAAAVRAHPIAGHIFKPVEGLAEQSMFWKDPATSVICRARMDWLPTPRKGKRLIVAVLFMEIETLVTY